MTTSRRRLSWRAWLLSAFVALGTACYPAHFGFRPHAEHLPTSALERRDQLLARNR